MAQREKTWYFDVLFIFDNHYGIHNPIFSIDPSCRELGFDGKDLWQCGVPGLTRRTKGLLIRIFK
jgi:hypothetical protein